MCNVFPLNRVVVTSCWCTECSLVWENVLSWVPCSGRDTFANRFSDRWKNTATWASRDFQDSNDLLDQMAHWHYRFLSCVCFDRCLSVTDSDSYIFLSTEQQAFLKKKKKMMFEKEKKSQVDSARKPSHQAIRAFSKWKDKKRDVTWYWIFFWDTAAAVSICKDGVWHCSVDTRAKHMVTIVDVSYGFRGRQLLVFSVQGSESWE